MPYPVSPGRAMGNGISELGNLRNQEQRPPANLYHITMPKKNRTRKSSSQEWLVYILRCGDGTLYTGITNDIGRRMLQHNDGIASRYTRCRRPIVLVYQEPVASRSLALKREAAIKSLTRQQKDLLIWQTC